MRSCRIVLPVFVLLVVLALSGRPAAAEQPAQTATPHAAAQPQAPSPQAASAQPAKPPHSPKKRSGLSFHGGTSSPGQAAAVTCAIYCGGILTSVTPAEDINDCACQCTATCGTDSCTDLDTGDLYFC
jgi:hypothetical protein